jgi:hypothetical protein
MAIGYRSGDPHESPLSAGGTEEMASQYSDTRESMGGLAKRSVAMSGRRRENMPALDFVGLWHGTLNQTALVI